VTFAGWDYLEKIRAKHIASVQAFVAMWFSKETEEAFDNGIEPAIKNCGYQPMRIDRKEHSNKIDDEIVAEIRRSRFLVADFTSQRYRPRGGVYFEAGFALGLNMPVIWCCRKDLIRQVHFDTRQFNHITWEDAGELRIKLTNRIGAVIGDGPLKAQRRS
jgi:nucleoside 2-deoxyribosyltransferase